jgi:hypothetical protein
MRVKRMVSRGVAYLDALAGADVLEWLPFPCRVRIRGGGRVNNTPVIVVITMRVQRNLLLFCTQISFKSTVKTTSVTYAHYHQDNCVDENEGTRLEY